MSWNQYNDYGGYEHDFHSEEKNRVEQGYTWNTHTYNSSPWSNQYPPQPEFQRNHQHEEQYTSSHSYNPHNFWQNNNHLQQTFREPPMTSLEEMLEKATRWHEEAILNNQLENNQREIEVSMQKWEWGQ